MESSTMARNIKGAIELVRMLEILVEGEINRSTGNMPWAGFRLLIMQAKDLLQPAFRTSARRPNAPANDSRSLVKGEDTLHLLLVLERISERLQHDEAEVPWFGIFHTLAQAREIMSVLAEMLETSEVQTSTSPISASTERLDQQWTMESVETPRPRADDEESTEESTPPPPSGERARNILSAFRPTRN